MRGPKHKHANENNGTTQLSLTRQLDSHVSPKSYLITTNYVYNESRMGREIFLERQLFIQSLQVLQREREHFPELNDKLNN